MRHVTLAPVEPRLDSVTVADTMHHGVVTCPPSADLREVAATLAENRVHCVVVVDAAGGDDERRVWGIVDDVDLMRALRSPVALNAGNLAALEVLTVAPDDTLGRAVQLMADHDTAHVVVMDHGRPAGVLSTLDVANTVAQPTEGTHS
jgi:CBS domain-containing protein